MVLLLVACFAFFAPHASSARLQRWLYYSGNLLVDSNMTNLQALFVRAAQSGYTHVLVSDSEFSHLDNVDAHYFTNIAYLKKLAADLGLEIVPDLFPVGFSNDLLSHDPNLIEALPVTNTLLVVTNGLAIIQPEPTVTFPEGGFSNLTLWTFQDTNVVEDIGSARVSDPLGQAARIGQGFQVSPFRQYHVSVRVKTQSFLGTPEIRVLGYSGDLNYNHLGVQPTQDWQTYHAVFNSLTNQQILVYFGCWDGTTGTLWWDNPEIEEVAFLNLVRRPGAPLTIQIENGTNLIEAADYPAFNDPLMGVSPSKGHYDVYHSPPVLAVNAPNGTRLRASWFHAVTFNDDQAVICPSEPATISLLRDQAQRMDAAWSAKGYLMEYDEIRAMNWCGACQQRNMDAGPMLATNVQTSIQILREVNPGGDIYVWSDMFDPYQNAQANYYLVRGNLAGSWLGLDPQVIIIPWDYWTRTNSLQFFSSRGHRQLIGGYYDSVPQEISPWLDAAKPLPGILGVMYTTWISNYGSLEDFSGIVSDFEIHNSWQVGVKSLTGCLQLELPTLSGHSYSILRSPDMYTWQPWTNFTSTAAITRCMDTVSAGQLRNFYRASSAP